MFVLSIMVISWSRPCASDRAKSWGHSEINVAAHSIEVKGIAYHEMLTFTTSARRPSTQC